MKISSHIMKDIGVTNKVGISDVLLFDKFKVLAFGGLGEISRAHYPPKILAFGS